MTVILCFFTLLTLIPTTVLAWTSTEGEKCKSYYGDEFVASDGDYYYSSPDLRVLIYRDNGTTYTKAYGSTDAKRKYFMRDDDGDHQVYCLEAGINVGTGFTYVSENGNNSEYFQNLPIEAQYGIMMTLLYGWHEGIPSPVEGTNIDDYAVATQLIIWEYQQQIRVNPTERFTNNGIDGDIYYSMIAGRPAEKCYHWILEQVARHYTIPSFAERSKNQAKTHTLQYDTDSGNYKLTLIDENNTFADIKIDNENISLTRNGNEYTFMCNEMITEPVTITSQKDITVDCGKMLIWGHIEYQTMVSGASDPVYFYLNLDTQQEGTCRIVKTSEDGKVEGVKFTISGNGINKTVTTDKDGTISLDLMPGEYTVTELVGDLYESTESHTVTVQSGQTAEVKFHNSLKRGSLKVIKTSEDNFTEGIKFHLYGTSGSGMKVDEYAVTDKDGIAEFENILTGSYTLEEVNTPDIYVIPESQTAVVEWNKVTEKSFHNTLKKWRAEVYKHDSEDRFAVTPLSLNESANEPTGEATLGGAVYGVYDGETLVDTYTTDNDGYFITGYYPCGDEWSIREITPSEGYTLDPTVYYVDCYPAWFEFEYNTVQMNVFETMIKGRVAISKYTDDFFENTDIPEAGAEFEVYLKSAGSYDNADDGHRDRLICDANGFAISKELTYGVYTVHQVKGWEGRENTADFDVYISEDGKTYGYILKNESLKSRIKVMKVDAETGKVITVSGAGFQIFKPDGSPVTYDALYPENETLDTFYTNDEGYLSTPMSLPYGKGYSLVEVVAPYGYVVDGAPITFDVTGENDVIELTKPNKAQRGTIKISKKGEVFASVSESGGAYQPVYSVSGLAGAVFEVRAAEDTVTPDSTVRFVAGELVDTVTTDVNGAAASRELCLGKYVVKEVTAPHGTVLNDETYTVELAYAGQEVELTSTSQEIFNARQKVNIFLAKVMEKNDEYVVCGNLGAVTFGLYAGENIVSADGTVIPADGLIEMISVDEDGTAEVKTDLPFGNYYVKELVTDGRYIFDETKYPFTFAYAGQEIGTVEIALNDGKPIENRLIYGSVSGRKVSDDGQFLGGALIGIFNADDTDFSSETAIAITTSADDGSFTFENVPYGSWIVREIESPEGYLLSEEAFAVNIGEVGQVVEITLTNNAIRGNIQLTKVDAEYPDNKLTGAVFEVYRDGEIVGSMTEVEAGIYEMKDLKYGEYVIKETVAPEGFRFDEGEYHVFIEEDGKTYVIENEAGVGFINEAQRGRLKIVKTSSDGKVEGFLFRVTNADGYDQTFTTDANGEIFIPDLRTGEYTISEVNDEVSADYVLPEDKLANVLTDSTTIVEMHNILRDTPDTGDGRMTDLWKELLYVSFIGLAGCGVVAVKRRKDE